MHLQAGTLFYLLASTNGLALRPQPRAMPSSSMTNISFPIQSPPPLRLKSTATRLNIALAAATPSGGVTPAGEESDGQWTTVQCGENYIDDATIDFAERWNAADVPGAWNAMLEKWNSEAQNNKFRGLSFSQFASYYFSGPEQWNCQDIGSVPCSTVVQCKDVEHPAGYLLLNAFSGIHQLHSEMHDALHTAMVQVQSKVGEFSALFAPQSDDTKIILAIFDGLTTILGFSLPAMFNVVRSDVASAASSITSSARSGSGSSAGSGSLFGQYEFNVDAYTADMVNQVYAITAAWTRNNAPKVHDKLGAQNSLSSALGNLFTAWKDLEVSYLQEIFLGDESSQKDLQALIGDGKMNFIPSELNQNAMAGELEAVLYGKMMPTAWNSASKGAGAHPFILKTDISCDNHNAQIPELHDYDIMSDEDSARTRACWNEKIVFLVNANEWDFFNQVHFTALPGADSNSLSGKNWGGITIDDIVASAMTGYETIGNNKNGYEAPGMEDVMNSTKVNSYGKVVRYPGFFNLPVCESIEQAKRTIIQNHHANSPYWPCADPEDLNKAGTTIHVNKGYINVDNKPVCDWINIADPGYGDKLNATIYARFDGDNTAESTVKPGCKLTVSWDKSFTDIYYGEDNCLYDSQSQQIPGEDGNHACCNESEGLDEKVSNPYVAGVQCQN